MIVFILEYLFMFLTGALLGWCLEVIYRRYFGLARKWINPGFLSGPYLPLYGTGVCLLYIVCNIQMILPLRILIFAILTTAIEYITGTFFLKKYNVRLWDYTSMKFNLHGHIAPLYTIFWTILSLLFYFILYPYFYQQIEFMYAHLEVSLLIGIFYGILFVDISNSFDVLNRLIAIKDLLDEKTAIIHLETLKEEMTNHIHDIQDKVEEIGNMISHSVESIFEKKQKASFFFPFKNKARLKVYLKEYIEKLKA